MLAVCLFVIVDVLAHEIQLLKIYSSHNFPSILVNFPELDFIELHLGWQKFLVKWLKADENREFIESDKFDHQVQNIGAYTQLLYVTDQEFQT